jgi:hypothetical protein
MAFQVQGLPEISMGTWTVMVTRMPGSSLSELESHVEVATKNFTHFAHTYWYRQPTFCP